MQTTSTKQTKSTLQLKEISIIPITGAVTQPPVEKPTNSSQPMADDDSADLLRKKRCTDRCDSSESSDRYVPKMFLHCRKTKILKARKYASPAFDNVNLFFSEIWRYLAALIRDGSSKCETEN
jgi:hypothetical protein